MRKERAKVPWNLSLNSKNEEEILKKSGPFLKLKSVWKKEKSDSIEVRKSKGKHRNLIGNGGLDCRRSKSKSSSTKPEIPGNAIINQRFGLPIWDNLRVITIIISDFIIAYQRKSLNHWVTPIHNFKFYGIFGIS